jgi:uncharacterized repeat protein (TIGR03803 family)
MSPSTLSTLAACVALPVFCAHAQKLTTLHEFAGNSDGASPYAGVTYRDGSLYGTTPLGGGTACGGDGCGTIFKLDPATGAETVFGAFDGSDGAAPFAPLVFADGAFYGTTTTGGASSSGTVFKLDPKTGAETVLYSFAGGKDGAFPAAGLIYQGGVLFGTTDGGGASGDGTIFSIKVKTGAETLLYSFAGGADGANPLAGVIEDAGTLYGTTAYGGGSDSGTVFAFNLSSGTETVLYGFTGGADGQHPYAALIDLSGTLYGTTAYGGAAGNGTVFTLDPSTGAETVLYSFKGSPDGAAPFAALTAVKNVLYGTTYYGGRSNLGAAFSVVPTTGAETVLFNFSGGKNGANPYAGLTAHAGALYGTTQYGGSKGFGSVFKLVP